MAMALAMAGSVVKGYRCRYSENVSKYINLVSRLRSG